MSDNGFLRRQERAQENVTFGSMLRVPSVRVWILLFGCAVLLVVTVVCAIGGDPYLEEVLLDRLEPIYGAEAHTWTFVESPSFFDQEVLMATSDGEAVGYVKITLSDRTEAANRFLSEWIDDVQR